jgi:hypothetical protein
MYTSFNFIKMTAVTVCMFKELIPFSEVITPFSQVITMK